MNLFSIDRLEQICGNRYIAVTAASKHARNLNSRLEEEEDILKETLNIEKEKITNQALRDLLDGKIKVNHPRSI